MKYVKIKQLQQLVRDFDETSPDMDEKRRSLALDYMSRLGLRPIKRSPRIAAKDFFEAEEIHPPPGIISYLPPMRIADFSETSDLVKHYFGQVEHPTSVMRDGPFRRWAEGRGWEGLTMKEAEADTDPLIYMVFGDAKKCIRSVRIPSLSSLRRLVPTLKDFNINDLVRVKGLLPDMHTPLLTWKVDIDSTVSSWELEALWFVTEVTNTSVQCEIPVEDASADVVTYCAQELDKVLRQLPREEEDDD